MLTLQRLGAGNLTRASNAKIGMFSYDRQTPNFGVETNRPIYVTSAGD
jgi:hypothetical protein